MWVIYLAIPLGSGLMCYRFIQAMILFLKTGRLHSHTQGMAEAAQEEQEALPSTTRH